MQQFKTFNGRALTLTKAGEAELDKYKDQLILCGTTEDKLNIIKNSENTGYIAVFDKKRTMIGLIQVDEIDEKTAHVKISIPDNTCKDKCGTEVMHKFIECCRKRKLYSRMYFKKDNSIVKKYSKERPRVLGKDYYIDIV